MRSVSRRPGLVPIVVVSVLVGVIVSSALAAQSGTGRLYVVVKVSDNRLVETPARASVTTPDGTLVDYDEELLVAAPNVRSFALDKLPAGVLDVRVEGEGMVTEVKKGVPVFAGRDESVTVVMRPGVGVHIVEFAVGGLSREEVATRLANLETETAKLKADIEALRAHP